MKESPDVTICAQPLSYMKLFDTHQLLCVVPIQR